MFFRLVLILGLLFLPSITSAVDTDGDSLHELFVYSPSHSRVTVHRADGSLISTIELNQSYINDDSPILFQGQHDNKAIVFSLTTDSKNEGTLHALSSEGRVKKISLGKLHSSTVLITNFAGSSSSDILYSDKKRGVYQIIDPLNSGSTSKKLPFKIRRGDKVSIISINGENTFVSYGNGKKKKRSLTAYSARGKRSKVGRVISKNGLVFPLLAKNGVAEMSFLDEKKGRKNTNYQFIDLFKGQKTKFTDSTKLSLGYFTETSSGAPQFAKINGSTVSFFESSNPATELSSIELDYGELPPPAGINPGLPPTSGGGGGQTDGCINTFPTAEIRQAKTALQNMDFTTFQSVMLQVQARNYCREIKDAIAAELASTGAFSSRSAKTTNEVALLGAPVYTSGKDQRKLGGCDKLRGNSDGPGGFLLKDGDHDGNLVTLAPAGFNTTKAHLVKPNLAGTIIKKLRYSGRSNGFRPTFRSDQPSNRHPRHLIVKFFVNSGFGDSEQAWCYEIKNSHVRND